MLASLIDGVAGTKIALDDRGLRYGDGLFETMLSRDARIALWSLHAERLAHGCARLALPAPDLATLTHEVDTLLAQAPRIVVVRITLTRGRGERGYAPPRDARTTRIVELHEVAPLPRAACEHGVRVRWADTRVGIHPALAGIKHLNRLEQVLAATEPGHAQCHESLLRDIDGRAVGAVAANLFACIDGELVTPDVTRAGVAGVCRAAVIADCGAREREIAADELERADELFLSNAVRGVVPVASLENRGYRVGRHARRAMDALAARGFVPLVEG